MWPLTVMHLEIKGAIHTNQKMLGTESRDISP